MSSKKDPQSEDKRKTRFSRRGFIGGVGWAPPAPVCWSAMRKGARTGRGIRPRRGADHAEHQRKTRQPEGRAARHAARRAAQSLDLTGAKRVCDRGTCGACTVILDGKSDVRVHRPGHRRAGPRTSRPSRACPGEQCTRSRRAFVNHDAQQCGYCTPGFVMATKGFLAEHPSPTMEQVKHGLGGNLCRCGTYMGIRKAVLRSRQAT